MFVLLDEGDARVARAGSGDDLGPLVGIEQLGAELVECTFMAELDFLEGRKKLPEGKVFSLLNF